MSLIGTYYIIEPKDWLFPSHGDVVEAKRRAQAWYDKYHTYEGAEQDIEEFVRQWALRQLVEVYHYPKEWLGEKIQIEKLVKMGSTEKECDIAIINDNHRVFLYVETKKGTFLTSSLKKHKSNSKHISLLLIQLRLVWLLTEQKLGALERRLIPMILI